jgi:hypothetical protein
MGMASLLDILHIYRWIGRMSKRDAFWTAGGGRGDSQIVGSRRSGAKMGRLVKYVEYSRDAVGG